MPGTVLHVGNMAVGKKKKKQSKAYALIELHSIGKDE